MQPNDEAAKFAQVEQLVKQHLTKEAIQRYGNIKAAYPQKAMQVVAVLAQAIQEGQVSVVDDKMLKSLLEKMQTKVEFNIRK